MTLSHPLARNAPPSDQLYVIYNPGAGRGRALSRLKDQLTQYPANITWVPTSRPRHAESLAREAADSGWPVVAAAGGDGTVHEVANGLLQSANRGCALALLPVGSANDYAFCLGLRPHWWSDSGTATRRQVDVGLIETTTGNQRFFVNGAGVGLNGAVTLESRAIPGLQGPWLYSAAVLRALWRGHGFPPLSTDIDGVVRAVVPTLAFSAAIGKREGSFLLAPEAQVDDGLFDYLHIGPMRWWEVLRYLPGVIRGRLPANHPSIWRGCCRKLRLQADRDLIIHLDGEMFAVPGDGVREVRITTLPGRLTVIGRFADQSPA